MRMLRRRVRPGAQLTVTQGSHAGEHVTVLGMSAVEPGTVRVRGRHVFRVYAEQLS